MTMTIATITLPTLDNAGRGVSKAHNFLASSLLAAFGGFSEVAVRGAWQDDAGNVYQDASVRYEVAMEDTAGNRETVRAAAKMAGDKAGQLCMFLTFGGVPEFMDLPAA